MSHKFGYCKVSISPVRAENKDQAEIVTQILFGEIIQIEEILGNWCKITTYFDNYPGWIDLKHFKPLSQKEINRWQDDLSYETSISRMIETPWGNQRIVKGSFVSSNKNQPFKIGNDPFRFLESTHESSKGSIEDVAMEYLNSPYLWGGKTPFGIDCSGLTQMVFRFFDLNLPRDASQQIDHGIEINFDEIESGDLAFFHNKEGKIIHVGIINSEKSIIHASGYVRIDKLTLDGIVNIETGTLTHHLNKIKRI